MINDLVRVRQQLHNLKVDLKKSLVNFRNRIDFGLL